MRRLSPSTIILVLFSLGTAALTAGVCGSSTPQGTTTPAAAVSGPDATAAAYLDAVNRRLAANNEPTIPPGSDLSHGVPYDHTAVARIEATIAALPKLPPEGLTCGPMAERHGIITTNYGPIRDHCGLFGTKWIVTTSGGADSTVPGVLAVYACAADDAACLAGKEPSTPGKWQIFPSLTGHAVDISPGGATIAPELKSRRLLYIQPGGYCFDLDTLEYVNRASLVSSPQPRLPQVPSQ